MKDIGFQLDSMIKHHRGVLNGSLKREFKCTVHGCNKDLSNLCYRVFRNNTKHLCGLCPKHGFTFIPYVKGLKIPTIDRNTKSKRKGGVRVAKAKTKLLF